MMTQRERVLRSIAHKAVDFIPHNVELTQGEMENVAKYAGIEKGKFDAWAGNHIEKFTCSVPDREVEEGIFEDEYGVRWNRKVDRDIGVVEKLLFPEPDINGYEFPPVDVAFLRKGLEGFVNNGRDTFKFAKINFSLFERAWSMRGFENTFMDFLCDPGFVHALMEKITERNLKILDIVCEYGCDGIYFGDDYGQQTGMLMSPASWREMIKPYLAKMFSRVKSCGKATCLHSCGNISPILPDLIEIGLDVYQTVQPEIYDLKQLKTEYGKDLCFYGCISTQRDLPVQTPENIEKLVRDTLSVMGPTGFIIAPTHKVPRDVPPENIAALVRAFKSQAQA